MILIGCGHRHIRLSHQGFYGCIQIQGQGKPDTLVAAAGGIDPKMYILRIFSKHPLRPLKRTTGLIDNCRRPFARQSAGQLIVSVINPFGVKRIEVIAPLFCPHRFNGFTDIIYLDHHFF